MQKRLHRQDRGHPGINHQHHKPEQKRGEAHHALFWQRQGNFESDKNIQQDRQHRNGGSYLEAEILFINAPAEDHRNRNDGESGEHHFRLGNEGFGRHHTEHGNHQQHGQNKKNGEHGFGPDPHSGLRDIGDGTTTIAHRDHQGQVIVNRADEHTAKHDPHQRDRPAKMVHGNDRPDDRPCTGNGRKIMPEQYQRLAGDIVHTIVLFCGGSLPAGLRLDQFPIQPFGIEPIAHKIKKQAGKNQYDNGQHKQTLKRLHY